MQLFVPAHWFFRPRYQNGINNCSIHSKCENTLGSYKCICHDGWRGIHCDEEGRTTLIPYSLIIEMDRCMSSPCSEAATCINDLKNKGYICICPEGYKGVHCQQSTFCPNYYRNAPVSNYFSPIVLTLHS
ncbi:EGF-like domain protein [Trichuris suis]|nr:EGF-like domain protein [Trichuris suis]